MINYLHIFIALVSLLNEKGHVIVKKRTLQRNNKRHTLNLFVLIIIRLSQLRYRINFSLCFLSVTKLQPCDDREYRLKFIRVNYRELS